MAIVINRIPRIEAHTPCEAYAAQLASISDVAGQIGPKLLHRIFIAEIGVVVPTERIAHADADPSYALLEALESALRGLRGGGRAAARRRAGGGRGGGGAARGRGN